MTVYERIRFLREKLGMSQSDLAIKMGYKSKSAISKVELGERDINQSLVVKYAMALNTTPAYLMGWIDEETNKKNDQLAELVVRLRHDEKFEKAVARLAELTPAQFATIDQLLADLTKK